MISVAGGTKHADNYIWFGKPFHCLHRLLCAYHSGITYLHRGLCLHSRWVVLMKHQERQYAVIKTLFPADGNNVNLMFCSALFHAAINSLLFIYFYFFMLEERHLLSWDQSFTLRTPELDPLAPPEKRKSTDHRVTVLPLFSRSRMRLSCKYVFVIFQQNKANHVFISDCFCLIKYFTKKMCSCCSTQWTKCTRGREWKTADSSIHIDYLG